MFMTSRPAVALLLVALSGIALAADAPAPPALVSTADHKAQSPEIAIGPDDSINMIWIDEDTAPKQHDPSHGHSHMAATNLYFSRSTDGGRTFSAPVAVNPKPGGV